ncbi:MAG TPA: FAD-dependent hydroxylase [Rhizobiales bacterium]|nr:FAD-dependent hydroxylase [Hyphomicrobiales bacterium]
MDYDIIIIGAGPAGLSFARSLADTQLKIALVERNAEKDLADPAYDGREIALTHLSHRLMNDLGMWQTVDPDKIALIKNAKVSNGNSAYSLNFDHNETDKENLGFMMSNNVIRKAAFDSLKGFDNITLLTEKEVTNVGSNASCGWIELADETKLKAPLVVAADSRFSTTRRMMGIATSMLDFGRTCIVCTMKAQDPHQYTAHECFHYDRTLAVLPLNNNEVSIVITLPSEETDSVMSMHRDDFARDIERRMDNKLGRLELSSELFAYPLVATFARNFYTNRFAVIGDAAVGMHPVTAHGFNLGLQSAHILASEIKKAIAKGDDFAASPVLARYSSKHTRTAAPIYHGTNALVRLYTTTTRPAKLARNALLHLGNIIKPAKGLIMDQLTEIKAEKSGRF